jgi:hypothetical protein
MRHDQPLALSRTGDTLMLNGESFDLSAIPEGATLPRAAVACDWLASDIERVNGQLHLTLILPHGPNAPAQTMFPAALHLTGDGPVELPPHDAAPEETA